ncbi:MAG TPA: MobF family relaxase [Acidimicrobiales bacterium]
MLRVAKVRSGGHAYYLEVAGGAGGTGIEAPGRWMGTAGPPMSLSGVVGPDPFAAVLAGEHPATGEVLGTARGRVRVAGFDLTFAAPKSVSVLHALGDPDVAEAVAAGHDEAVRAAVSYVERRALAVRRRDPVAGAAVPATVDGVAAAGFVHRVSRALDPHLHTHVVVANVGRGPEGAWSALDGRGVYAHASATDALYHVHLRYELSRRLGVSWDPPDRGRADIAGIGPHVRREFSRRAAAIAAHLAERDLGSGRAKTVAGFATRAERDPLVGADALRPQWQDRARAVGLGPRRLEAVLDRVPRAAAHISDAAGDRDTGRAAAVADALADLHRGVSRRDVVRAWCRSSDDGAPAPQVEAAADRMLEQWRPQPGPLGQRQGPGVAERRHEVESPSLERDGGRDRRRAETERVELSRLLVGRGIGLDRFTDRRRDGGLALG